MTDLPLIDLGLMRARSRLRLALVAVCLAVVGGLFTIAFVQAKLVVNQSQLDTMRSEIVEARKEQARLAQAVDEASSPISIVTRAQALGMVRAIQPEYLIAVGSLPQVDRVELEVPSADEADQVAAPATPINLTTKALSEQPGVAITSPLAGSRAETTGTGSE